MPAKRSRPQESSALGHGDLADYLTELTSRLEAQLGDRLVAAWVIGSGALGDFDPLRSDVDVQAVSDSRLDRARLQRLAGALSHDALPCPVRGLEFVLYAHVDLADPDGPAFQLNLNTGPGMQQHEGFDPRPEPRFWFTLDVAIARQQARSLAGPPPSEVLPFLSRSLVVGALSDALAWYRAYDDAQAVLAGCRAWAWTSDGTWRSKGEAATWARARLADPTAVDWALARRAHPEPHEPPPSAVAAFFDLVTSSLENARNT
jgi:hypothetical protein